MELIATLAENGPLLAAVAAVMLVGPVATALVSNGYLSKMLESRGRARPAELDARMGEIEKGFVPNLDDVLARIEGKLDALSKNVAEVEKRLNHVDKSALMGIIYNPAIHTVDRIRAFICYLKLGGNGLVAEHAFSELVAPNREAWIRELQESRMPIRCENYHEKIYEIGRRLNEAVGAF